MNRPLLFLLVLVCYLTGCATATARAKRNALPGKIYVVKKGDTPGKIAEHFDADTQDLLDTNGINSAKDLVPGQILFVPVAPESIASNKAQKLSRSKTKPAIAESTKSHAPKWESPSKKYPDDGKAIKLAWPIKNGVILRTYEDNPAKLHEGLSIGAPARTQVHAAAEGEVLYVGDEGTQYGQMVIIRHKEPFVTVYANLDRVEVKEGDNINTGATIGTVGTSGGAESPRVHFQVRKNRVAVDPKKYLAKR